MERLKKPLGIEAKSDVEKRIAYSEKSLGIKNKFDRLLEASLYIDKHFFDFALLTGQIDTVERIFGDEAWANYLDARIFAKKYGKQPLTADFIIDLQEKFSQNTPEHSRKIRPPSLTGRPRLVSYNNRHRIGKPLKLTLEQQTAIQENPDLKFDPDGTSPNTGVILLPKLNEVEILNEMHAICDQYNKAKAKRVSNSYQLTAVLQRKFISLHPFTDYCGRVSRVLMNWSLENDGQNPSLLYDFDEDLFSSEETWIHRVREGSVRFGLLKKRKILGLEDYDKALLDSFLSFPYSQVGERYKKFLASLPSGQYHNSDHIQSDLSSILDAWFIKRDRII